MLLGLKQGIPVFCLFDKRYTANMQAQSKKHAHLIHNPKAGDRECTKSEIVKTVTGCGFTCTYASIKAEHWDRLDPHTTLVVVAGGDGTVRQVMKKMLARTMLDRRLAIALLPIGTANNFAKALDIGSGVAALGSAIKGWTPRPVDIGAVGNLPGASFFLESIGWGMLPKLMKAMEAMASTSLATAQQELEMALAKLIEIAGRFKPKSGTVIIDGKLYEGDYLFVEVLNTSSVGPNLRLAPHANPSDGKFSVALLEAGQREAFIDYVQRYGRAAGRGEAHPADLPWQLIEAEQVIVRSQSRLIHVDDELFTSPKGRPVTVEIRAGIVDVLV